MAKRNPHVEELLKRHDALVEIRRGHESAWEKIDQLVSPTQAKLNTGAGKGTNVWGNIFDSSPVRANNTLAATLGFLITNQSVKWLGLDVHEGKETLEKDEMESFQLAEKVLSESFGDTNFYDEVDKFWLSYSGYGTSGFYVEEGSAGEPYYICKTIPIWELYFAENKWGETDTVHREYRMTLRQAQQEFGLENLSRASQRRIVKQKKLDEEITVLHCVYPRVDFKQGSKFAKDFEFASVYIEKDSHWKIEEGGYHEMPYMISRFRLRAGESYGRGPAEEALADIITLNTMSKTNIKVARKNADPPYDIILNSYIGRLNTGANKANYRQKGFEKASVLHDAIDIPFALDMEDRRRASVDKSFFVDVLRIPHNDRMTTLEIRKYQQEAMQVLGPTFGRIAVDFLRPLIIRVFWILFRAGAIELPESMMEDGKLRIQYESPLARAQKSQEVENVLEALGKLEGIAKEVPEIWRRIDWEYLLMLVFKNANADMKVIKDDKVYQAEEAERQKQEAEMRTAALAQSMAKAGKDASGMDMEKIKSGIQGVM